MQSVRLFKIAGISVSANVWFLVLLLFFGMSAGSLQGSLIAMASVFASLLVHEFGHGLVAKRYGLRPRISLHGWGGLCHHAPAPTATQDILITLAGPGAGLLAAGLLSLLSVEADGSLGSVWVHTLIWINVFWSLANLIPLWPLDGGQVLQVALRTRMGARRGDRLTHRVSLFAGGTALLYALVTAQMFLLLMVGFILFENAKKLGIGGLRPGAQGSWSGTSSPYRGQSAMSVDWRPTPTVRTFLWILGGIWLATAILGAIDGSAPAVAVLMDHLHLHYAEATSGFQAWQVLTYMWLHDLTSMNHILGNLFGLWILGSMLERHLGPKAFFRLTLQMGVGAGVFSVVLGWLLPTTFGQPVIGASGAIIGMVAALSILLPNEQLLLLFIVPIRAKWLIWIVLAVDTLAFLGNPLSDLAWQTHVGGALAAWILIHRLWDLRVVLDRLRLWKIGRGRRKPKGSHLHIVPGGKDDPPTLH